MSGDQITIRSYVQDEELYLEVEDTGPGISSEAQMRLFERFYRVPESKHKVKGTGLGLAIVKSVAMQHGGRVFVQSKVGQGSIFGMVFPLSSEKGSG